MFIKSLESRKTINTLIIFAILNFSTINCSKNQIHSSTNLQKYFWRNVKLLKFVVGKLSKQSLCLIRSILLVCHYQMQILFRHNFIQMPVLTNKNLMSRGST